MKRIDQERKYWDAAALDPDVDKKYICDLPTDQCLVDLEPLMGKVLEIGCGVGRLLKDGDCGIDVSVEMLNLARKRKPKCEFKVTSGKIPYPREYFDTVFSYLVFQHLKPNTIKTYIAEAYRVLKPGGEFKFQFIEGTEREPFSNHYSINELAKWMHDRGFDTVWHVKSNVHEQWRLMGAMK